ncbi:hypothetical protein GWI33_000119 [Rhynchophorus ferrugineus]|uniref:Uncharacterized protein n=1 Tax=Rhynchophorus ferrugineus TaxID=354439 RepID=A0A834IX74_RHYFE|nr:hypothetical protein GWI33_000119 [Rhynchophorus ferrugineus]
MSAASVGSEEMFSVPRLGQAWLKPGQSEVDWNLQLLQHCLEVQDSLLFGADLDRSYHLALCIQVFQAWG